MAKKTDLTKREQGLIQRARDLLDKTVANSLASDRRRKAAAVASAAERAAADAKKNRRAAAARRMDDVERRASALLRSIEDRERAKRGFPNRTSSVGLAVGIASNAAKKRAAAKSKGKKK